MGCRGEGEEICQGGREGGREGIVLLNSGL
jgi:hypothetical protein